MRLSSARSCSKTANRSICLHASNNKSSSATSRARFAPGHWGTPAQMLESLRQTTDTAVETLRRKLQDRSSAGRQQLVTPAHNAPLPPPPPPPPPAIPIPTATATQSTPLTTQLTAHTNANQQHSSAVLASSHAPQQFLPQRLGVSQQEIPLLQQTVPAFWVLMGRPVHPTHNFLEQGRQSEIGK